MNYLIGLALLSTCVLALRQAGYSWAGASAGGAVVTVTALTAGVALSQYFGFPHPSMGMVTLAAVSFIAFVGTVNR